MTAWEELDDIITLNNIVDFTAEGLAALTGKPTPVVTHMIQAHLIHQKGAWAISPYVITRTGRTRAAVWHVGSKTANAKALSRQTANDFRCRIEDFVQPVLMRMEELTPQAQAAVQVSIQALLFSASQLESMLP